MIYLKNDAKFFIKKFLFADLLLTINCLIHILINGPYLNLYFDNNFYYIYFEKFKSFNYIFHYNFLNVLFCINYVFGYSFIIFLPFFLYFFFKNEKLKFLIFYFNFLSVELWLGYYEYCSGLAIIVNYHFNKYFLYICYFLTVISLILFLIKCLTFKKPQKIIVTEVFPNLNFYNDNGTKIEVVTKNLSNFEKNPKTEAVNNMKNKFSFVNSCTDLLSVDLLSIGYKIQINIDCEKQKQLLVGAFEDFGISIEVVDIFVGPVVTLYSIEIAPGIKASRVISLSSDIARLMYAYSVRISTVPGKNLLGVEISNPKRQMVYFKEGMMSKIYNNFSGNLPLYLGCNIYGDHEVFDLSTMPHLLVAGTTGSGKSVGIHTMLLSLLYKKNYEEVKLILIDPKKLELTPYEEIPHLLLPVVTEAKKAIQAVKWVVDEMERRYFSMSKLGVRNIISYNEKIKTLKKSKIEGENFEKIPYIVVVVDEMADLMLVVGKEFEMYIQRIAQMGRAAGIHMIIATQRPSVDVITGTIKANFPTRISFKLSSKIDSRTILGDMSGAEQLLGSGDMLHLGNSGKIIRIHGSYVSEEDVFNVVSWLKTQAEPKYIDLSFDGIDEDSDQNFEDDPYYEEAIALIKAEKKVSTSFLQRCFPIGYNRAAKLIERMEKQGIITKGDKFGRNRDIIE